MDDLSYVRDSVRSTRTAIKSAQRSLRALLQFVADLDERLDVLENAQSSTGRHSENGRSTEKVPQPR